MAVNVCGCRLGSVMYEASLDGLVKESATVALVFLAFKSSAGDGVPLKGRRKMFMMRFEVDCLTWILAAAAVGRKRWGTRRC